MARLLENFALENVVRRAGQNMKIFSGTGEEIGTIERGTKGSAGSLVEPGGRRWVLDPSVMGQHEPFSLTVREEEGGERGSSRTALMILHNLFAHEGRSYMFTGMVAGAHPRDVLTGERFITRLDNFPFANTYDVDMETVGRLRRYFRGVIVGELIGLGSHGHSLRLAAELSEIALPLTASSFLLYSSG